MVAEFQPVLVYRVPDYLLPLGVGREDVRISSYFPQRHLDADVEVRLVLSGATVPNGYGPLPAFSQEAQYFLLVVPVMETVWEGYFQFTKS